MSDLQNNFTCTTNRAPDYYGLGVRLGIYFSWMQAYIANNYIPDEISGSADTNTIFLFTLVIAMIKCSAINMLEQIDGLILMHLATGFLFGTLSIWGYRTRQYVDKGPAGIRSFGGYGTHARLLVSLAVCVFGLWYWMFAVTGSLLAMGSPQENASTQNRPDPPNSPNCQTLFTFMFGKVRADGGIRIFYIIVYLLCTVYFGIMILTSTVAGWTMANKFLELWKEKRWAESIELRYATGLKYGELERLYKCLRVLNLIWIALSVLFVEITLHFNHFSAVVGGPHTDELHLPAQLLPLLIGAFGFLRSCYLLLVHMRSRGEALPSLGTSSPVQEARTMHMRDLPLAFSPAMARSSITTSHDPNEIDELVEKRRSKAVRYLVAWLPWLSLLEPLYNNPENGKRLNRNSGIQPQFKEMDFAPPPRRIRDINDLPRPIGGGDIRYGETV